MWAPIGERPIASVNHRYEWLYLYSFVHPLTGQTDQLEEVLVERCCILSHLQSQVQALTNYHWWPNPEAAETG